MEEKEWVGDVVKLLNESKVISELGVEVSQSTKLPYAYEIRSYSGGDPIKNDITKYETDILISSHEGNGEWKPRVVIEAKLSRVTTHEAITYSEKAITHKNVHPYLRYGIFLGNRKHYPLPGRLYRHGAYFDFMISWQAFRPKEDELAKLIEIIKDEVKASRDLEEIIYSSRKSDRKRYTVLHRPLILKE